MQYWPEYESEYLSDVSASTKESILSLGLIVAICQILDIANLSADFLILFISVQLVILILKTVFLVVWLLRFDDVAICPILDIASWLADFT